MQKKIPAIPICLGILIFNEFMASYNLHSKRNSIKIIKDQEIIVHPFKQYYFRNINTKITVHSRCYSTSRHQESRKELIRTLNQVIKGTHLPHECLDVISQSSRPFEHFYLLTNTQKKKVLADLISKSLRSHTLVSIDRQHESTEYCQEEEYNYQPVALEAFLNVQKQYAVRQYHTLKVSFPSPIEVIKKYQEENLQYDSQFFSNLLQFYSHTDIIDSLLQTPYSQAEFLKAVYAKYGIDQVTKLFEKFSKKGKARILFVEYAKLLANENDYKSLQRLAKAGFKDYIMPYIIRTGVYKPYYSNDPKSKLEIVKKHIENNRYQKAYALFDPNDPEIVAQILYMINNEIRMFKKKIRLEDKTYSYHSHKDLHPSEIIQLLIQKYHHYNQYTKSFKYHSSILLQQIIFNKLIQNKGFFHQKFDIDDRQDMRVYKILYNIGKEYGIDGLVQLCLKRKNFDPSK
ncbi:hypothetical protein HK103_007564 [Boothiomyces macroporosus]|uniref:Uncharacterized protein n=1 Tax=Boothiomyces macroporosus TaxID=261099 RepID=A0AAD5UBW3_9FUNG|nr:hypothetical protein HK103_007564 [Boothiomyces macroporosus]